MVGFNLFGFVFKREGKEFKLLILCWVNEQMLHPRGIYSHQILINNWSGSRTTWAAAQGRKMVLVHGSSFSRAGYRLDAKLFLSRLRIISKTFVCSRWSR